MNEWVSVCTSITTCTVYSQRIGVVFSLREHLSFLDKNTGLKLISAWVPVLVLNIGYMSKYVIIWLQKPKKIKYEIEI